MGKAMRRYGIPGITGRLPVLLVLLAVVAALLHAGNLLYLAHASDCSPFTLRCDGGFGPFATPDTATYVRVADKILSEGILGTSYIVRTPGYPLLLSVPIALTGSPSPALWIGPLLAGLAAAAIAWMAFRMTGHPGPAVAAGIAFCCWPNTYQLSPLLLTDAAHGFAAVAALAATLWWRDSERAAAAALASGLWLFTELLRLTFLWIPAALPLLLFKRGASAFYVRCSLALWTLTFLPPCLMIGSNWLRHDVAAPSAIPAANLACYSVPRLRAEMGQGSFVSFRKRCTKSYLHLDYGERIPTQLADARRFLLAHAGPAAASFAGEIATQLTSPLRPYYYHYLAPLYAGWYVPGSWFLVLFWLCGALGLALLFRSAPHEAAFLALVFIGVMLPAATSHLVGGRLRFPLDLLFLPLVAAVFFPRHLLTGPRSSDVQEGV